MKKYLLIAGLGGIMAISSATAVTKCLNTSLFDGCSFPSGSGSNFYVQCNGGMSVNGFVFCGPGYSDISSEVTVSSNADDNTNCWCRMVKPAVSQWVRTVSFGSETLCLNECAKKCANYFRDNVNSMRTKMLQDLSN